MNVQQTPAKLLLVDDLEENLLALEALLVQGDVEVLKARSGTEALELLLVHDIALALVDVQMPELDGFELAELMRGAARTQHIPIIFVTAGAWERNRLFRGYDAGAVDFLFKPIDAHILRHKVQTFVSLYQQRKEIAEQLTALRRSEAEARSLKDELQRTLQLNETFVAAISHDLKNPLNAILLATELLLSRCRPEECTVVERARSSARRMNHMIEQLFDLSRARLAGGVPLALE
ncbi:MAG TPA: response regulator, partial [Polyangiales bacterium]|nr:response regulator [Polyangiales bacterium]